jgi:hypothetical protein
MPLADDESPDGARADDDRDAVDRAFFDLVAGYHLTADPPDPLVAERSGEQQSTTAPAEIEEERFVPPPVPPLRRPALPAVFGWIGISYAVVFVLLTAVGIRLPAAAGWLAVAGFVSSFAILLSRLPRSRPPGDGAVL